MERAGIDMLDPEAGVALVRQELTASGRRGEVLLGERLGVLLAERHATGGIDPERFAPPSAGPLAGRIVELGLHDGLGARTRLDPASQPFLRDHQIDGTPVLPGVMGIEAFAELAIRFLPDLSVRAVDDVQFLAPFKFYRDQPRELEWRARFEPGEQGEVVAHCRLVGRRSLPGRDAPQETEHFRAAVRMAARNTSEARSVETGPAPARAVGPDAIYQVYFHGPAFRVLAAAWGEGERTLGRMADGLPPAFEPADTRTLTAPRLVELAFQTAGVGEIGRSGRMGLPQHIASLELAGEAPATGDGCACVVTPGDVGVDAQVVDASGREVLRLRGYATAALPTTIPEALRAPLAAAVTPEKQTPT
jgi:hypothetical protein